MERIQPTSPLQWQGDRMSLKGKAAHPVCKCPGAAAGNTDLREDPFLAGTHRYLLAPKAFSHPEGPLHPRCS